MQNAHDDERVLAIDPTTRGFGYAALEGPGSIIDWGHKESREATHAHGLRQVAGLLKSSLPDVLVLENPASGRRCGRIKDLLTAIAELARAEDIPVAFIGREEVKKIFTMRGAKTHDAIAKLLAGDFPALAHRLPPPRKPWKNEDPRLRIFSAVALAIAYYLQREQAESGPGN